MSALAQQGERSRALILDALLDLPLGTSLRDVARIVGKHVKTVDHHVHKLRKTGHLQVVKRGYAKRRVVVPVRVRLSEEERDWLKLGPITARVVVVVARAEGRRVTSSEVAVALGWHQGVTRYHLQRAREAGVLDALHGAGYTLACAHPRDQARAGLDAKALEAVAYIARQGGRRVSSAEVARAHGWTLACAKYHLKRAVKAGLLHPASKGHTGGYRPTEGAHMVNWQKTAQRGAADGATPPQHRGVGAGRA